MLVTGASGMLPSYAVRTLLALNDRTARASPCTAWCGTRRRPDDCSRTWSTVRTSGWWCRTCRPRSNCPDRSTT
ncbi:hypothetical protein GTV15_02320 [Streptomyces sp. SID7803]|nr:hypothetical protein [Streptomyces sp. SID7803]